MQCDKIVILQEEAEKALDVIRRMIRFESTDRINMDQVLQSSFFEKMGLAHYQLYDNANIKPGLCLIINQDNFYLV